MKHIEISASELVGAISDTAPAVSPFGPVLQLSASEYASCTCLRLPQEYDGGAILFRVNFQRTDSEPNNAELVAKLIAPGTAASPTDIGNSTPVDLTGTPPQFDATGWMELYPFGTWTGNEFLSLWLSVPEPTENFRCNVRSIEMRYNAVPDAQ